MALLLACCWVPRFCPPPARDGQARAMTGARNDGSLVATAQLCGFDGMEIREELVPSMERTAIDRARAGGIGFDSAAYREVFLASNGEMHGMLDLMLSQPTTAQKRENCVEVRKQWDRVRDIHALLRVDAGMQVL